MGLLCCASHAAGVVAEWGRTENHLRDVSEGRGGGEEGRDEEREGRRGGEGGRNEGRVNVNQNVGQCSLTLTTVSSVVSNDLDSKIVLSCR